MIESGPVRHALHSVLLVSLSLHVLLTTAAPAAAPADDDAATDVAI